MHNKSREVGRRSFLKSTMIAGAGASLMANADVWGANDRVNIGVIGCGGRGTGHVGWAEKSGGTVVAVCDVDKKHMAKAAKKARTPENVKQHQDMRDLLDDKDIDAVVIATPNHWHALATVWACQAGKDVYVEKPVSHSIWEGRKMVEAARKYDRIVQAGTQGRSSSSIRTTRELVAKKELGDVQWAHSFWYKHRGPLGKVDSPQSVPDHIDYNLWCGPRAKVPLMRNKFHYFWHWFYPYGNGDMGNVSLHAIDSLHHILRMGNDIPQRMMAVGGRFKYNDDATAPNTEVIMLDWDVPLLFSCRNLPLVNPKTGKKGGASVYRRFNKSFRFSSIINCEDGFFAVNRKGGGMYDHDGKRIRQIKGDGGGKNMRNFIAAVRSRKVEDLNADIEEAVMANMMMLSGNISYRCGKPASTDAIGNAADYCQVGKETWGETVAHLERNGVELDKEQATLGPWLRLDPKQGYFKGERDSVANNFVREFMRREFSIPEKV